jgi:hypothetical protein
MEARTPGTEAVAIKDDAAAEAPERSPAALAEDKYEEIEDATAPVLMLAVAWNAETAEEAEATTEDMVAAAFAESLVLSALREAMLEAMDETASLTLD